MPDKFGTLKASEIKVGDVVRLTGGETRVVSAVAVAPLDDNRLIRLVYGPLGCSDCTPDYEMTAVL